MCPASAERVSVLLLNRGRDDKNAPEELIPLVYGELRRTARRYLWQKRPDHTLRSDALVHKAFLRLFREKPPPRQNRTNFFGVGAQLMRRILVDQARTRLAAKSGTGPRRLALDSQIAPSRRREVDLSTLVDALTRLATLDPQQSHLIEPRFFGGHSIEETEFVLGISRSTMKRECAMARAWRQREMKGKEARK